MKRLIFAAMLVAGCGGSDELVRLSVGQEVILYDAKENYVFVIGPTCGGAKQDHAYFDVGTKATVVDDSGPDHLGNLREVRVNVRSSPSCATAVPRKSLRPVK